MMANNEEGNDSCMYNANLFFAPRLYCRWCIGTTKNQYNKYKNHFFYMKGDIGMANYENRVEQEAAFPISLYNCYRTVRHEKRYQEYTAMPLFSCLTVL